MSERQYEFDDLDFPTLPGVLAFGRVWVEFDRDGWRIESVEMTEGARFVALDMRNEMQARFADLIKARLEADKRFVAKCDDDHAEEYPERSDYEEHSTYRVWCGSVVG